MSKFIDQLKKALKGEEHDYTQGNILGEKNPEAATHAGAQAIILALLASIVLGAIGIIYSSEILKLMGASPEVVNEGVIFAEILIGGNAVILLLFLINGIFRGAGNAAMTMRSLWIASGTNIILCPVLIHFWGLKGAAIATVLGRSTGVAYQFYHLLQGDGLPKFRWNQFKFDLALLAWHYFKKGKWKDIQV